MNQAVIESTMVDSALVANDSIRVLLEAKIGSLQVVLTKALEANNEGVFHITTEWIALIFAVLVVLVTAIIQFYAARKQFKTQIAIAEQQNKTQLRVGELQANTQLITSKQQIAAQLEVANKQIKADVLSKNRQIWIDTLTEHLSEFMSLIAAALAADATDDEKKIDIDWIAKWGEKSGFVLSKIELLLNPEDPEHRNLVTLLYKLFDCTTEQDMRRISDKLDKLRDDIVVASQKILRDARNKVEQMR